MQDGIFQDNSQNFTLDLNDVNPVEHAGEYSCEMTFQSGVKLTDTTTVIVRRTYVIGYDGEVASSIVSDENTLVIKCMIAADMEPSSSAWYANGKQIVFDRISNVEVTFFRCEIYEL